MATEIENLKIELESLKEENAQLRI